MEKFTPGDRVVAINIDLSAPFYSRIMQPACISPDGPPRENTIYHVEGIKYTSDGHQGVFITGLRVLVGNEQCTSSSCRFRKVDLARDCVMNKKKRKQLLVKLH